MAMADNARGDLFVVRDSVSYGTPIDPKEPELAALREELSSLREAHARLTEELKETAEQRDCYEQACEQHWAALQTADARIVEQRTELFIAESRLRAVEPALQESVAVLRLFFCDQCVDEHGENTQVVSCYCDCHSSSRDKQRWPTVRAQVLAVLSVGASSETKE